LTGTHLVFPTPKCVEHDYDMILERFKLQGEGQNRRVVDVYGCPISGCATKYAEVLGGYGIFNAGQFVLTKAGPN